MAADENLKQFRDATGVPDSGGFHIDTGNLARALQVWQDSPIFSLETWREFGRAFSSSVQLRGPEDLKWLQGSGSAVSDTSPQALLAGASSENFWNAQLCSRGAREQRCVGAASQHGVPRPLVLDRK